MVGGGDSGRKGKGDGTSRRQRVSMVNYFCAAELRYGHARLPISGSRVVRQLARETAQISVFAVGFLTLRLNHFMSISKK
jgi:hypothetical protein